MAATYLDRILAHHRARAADDHRDLESQIDAARALPAARGFRSALLDARGLAVIAEIKRRSPSKGDLNVDLDPASLAAAYAAGGASCLSVLTDTDHFGGSVADLQTARASCSLPVIRKDFTVSELDVVDTRLMGADCVLLIAAALSDDELFRFHARALAIGLDALVEIHDEGELRRALDAGATLIGVNQRDLVTFEVDSERAARVGGAMPDTVVRVAESGIRGPDDAAALAAVGFDAVLVGELLVTSGDPESAVARLRGAG
jgi:indole-3-glycerol phosphate synthase